MVSLKILTGSFNKVSVKVTVSVKVLIIIFNKVSVKLIVSNSILVVCFKRVSESVMVSNKVLVAIFKRVSVKVTVSDKALVVVFKRVSLTVMVSNNSITPACNSNKNLELASSMVFADPTYKLFRSVFESFVALVPALILSVLLAAPTVYQPVNLIITIHFLFIIGSVTVSPVTSSSLVLLA